MALPITRRWLLVILVGISFVVLVTLVFHRLSFPSDIDNPSLTNELDTKGRQNKENCVNKNDNWETINPDDMTAEEIEKYLLWTNQTSCGLTHDFGGKMMKRPSGYDGQKAVCLDKNVAPLPGKCIIYSFGINYEWSFDEAMEQYGCKVFAFDPSMKTTDYQYSKAISFYNLGLGGKSTKQENGWTIKTLSDIYTMLKPIHSDVVIDYLKIDIEHAEWDTIPNMIESGMLKKVRQMGIEFHLSSGAKLEHFRNRIKIIRSIEKAGFIRFDSKYNPWFHGKIPGIDSAISMGYEIAWYQHLPYTNKTNNMGRQTKISH